MLTDPVPMGDDEACVRKVLEQAPQVARVLWRFQHPVGRRRPARLQQLQEPLVVMVHGVLVRIQHPARTHPRGGTPDLGLAWDGGFLIMRVFARLPCLEGRARDGQEKGQHHLVRHGVNVLVGPRRVGRVAFADAGVEAVRDAIELGV